MHRSGHERRLCPDHRRSRTSSTSTYSVLPPWLLGNRNLATAVVIVLLFSAIASTTISVGAAIGLAVLVLVANSETDGLAGERLRVATADGLRTAVRAIAAAIAAMTPIAFSLGSGPASHAAAERLDTRAWQRLAAGYVPAIPTSSDCGVAVIRMVPEPPAALG